MATCEKIRRKKRRVCIGDLKHRVTLEDRDLTAPLVGVDAAEVFTNPRGRWALVETTRGSEFFDDVNVAQDITHGVYLRYDPEVTAETWIKLRNEKRLNILDVENIDEESEFLFLRCTDRGDATKQAADG